ncbi:MAG: sigma 54-interacting transcriptional regulator [Syntrophorhabdales bacterium]
MRFSPRVEMKIPAEIERGAEKRDVLIIALGLDGAFIKNSISALDGKPPPNGLIMRYELPQQGVLEHTVNIVRKDADGYALSFHDVAHATKLKLWQYIVDNMVPDGVCFFCGQRYTVMPEVCKNCGWDLAIDKQGYFEYHEKMVVVKRLENKVKELKLEQLQKLVNFVDVDLLKVRASEEMQDFVGTSPHILQIFSKIRKVAKTELSVLILGESGTGKELTALAIHERSARKNRPFVTINCAAIPENLLEAELFGHEKGSFTGAYATKKGKMESADGGTVFLDEIGEMPMSLQAKLLRFLQDRIVERVGSTSGKKVNVRVIAATNCDLDLAIQGGRFRSDLYYRLDEFAIQLPPLRDRGEDVVLLAKFFLNRFSAEMGLTKVFTKKALDAIEVYNWPGNVRELINKIRRAIVMSDGTTISVADLGIDGSKTIKSSGVIPLKEEVNHVEAQKVKEILELCSNNISKAAKLLKVSRPSLYSRIKKYNIDTSATGMQPHSLTVK